MVASNKSIAEGIRVHVYMNIKTRYVVNAAETTKPAAAAPPPPPPLLPTVAANNRNDNNNINGSLPLYNIVLKKTAITAQ